MLVREAVSDVGNHLQSHLSQQRRRPTHKRGLGCSLAVTTPPKCGHILRIEAHPRLSEGFCTWLGRAIPETNHVHSCGVCGVVQFCRQKKSRANLLCRQ